jgi:serine/threonine protein kinase/tetratricopeptide (TPR) repeat protein
VNDWSKVEDLFHSALRQPPSERIRFLELACPDNPDLRAQVHTLLKRAAAEGSFLEEPPISAIKPRRTTYQPGQEIGRFVIVELIGAGGMGEVYRAKDKMLRRDVAVKVLPAAFALDPGRKQRFLREARSAAALNHPNICTVYEIDEQEGQLFIAMEYCDGMPLYQLIRRRPLALAAAISIVLQVAEALAEAHRRQIIHRDVKSSNVIVDAKTRARLLDFGLASGGSSSDSPGDSTLTIEHIGTPAYMAPERFELGVNDVRGDIWGLGVVLYEAITGRLPFAGDHAQLAYSIVNTYPPPASSLRAGLPPELDDIVDKALAKEPSERYQTVANLAEDLEQILRIVEPEGTPVATVSMAGVPGAHRTTEDLSTGKERVHAVAVLPFVNMSRNAEDDFLSDGLTEEITNALTQVRGLRVVSRASTFQFRSPSLDLREVGRRLRVGALVLGTVRREADRVRVTAQLVRASNGYQIWSQRFDAEMRGVFEVEDQLTGTIVDHLRQWLGADLELAHLRGSTSNFGAHELYLRGRYSLNLQTPQGVANALRLFSQAVELAPEYALARVGIADCYALQGWYGIERPVEVMPKAKASLDAAIAIEERLQSAWCLRAAITAGFDWNWEGTRTQFEKAFSLGPSTSVLHFHHALDFLTPLQRLEEALAEAKIALGLDPAAPLVSTAVGGCLHRLRRYPAAIRQLQSTLELAPDFYHAHWTMGRVYESQGQFPEAIACFERALGTSGNNPAVLADAGHCRAVMGDTDVAREILKRVTGVPLAMATICLGLKETDAALEHLREAVNERARGLIWLGVDPRFDAIRDTSGFRAVLSSVGLPQSPQN